MLCYLKIKTRENFLIFFGHKNFLNFCWNPDKPIPLSLVKLQK